MRQHRNIAIHLLIMILVVVAVCMTFNIYKTQEIENNMESSISEYIDITNDLSNTSYVTDNQLEYYLERMERVKKDFHEINVNSNIVYTSNPLISPKNGAYLEYCAKEYIDLYDRCYEESDYAMNYTCNASVMQEYNSNCYFCIVGEHYLLKGNATATENYLVFCDKDPKNYLNI